MTRMEFITNNFDWSPFTVCKLYLARWEIEICKDGSYEKLSRHAPSSAKSRLFPKKYGINV